MKMATATYDRKPTDDAGLGNADLLRRGNHKIELTPVGRLKAYSRNARTHTRKQIRQIADSVKRFGFTNPVLIDDEDRIIAGHGRVEAAKHLGLAAIPSLRLSHLSDAEKRAYILADNRLAEWQVGIVRSLRLSCKASSISTSRWNSPALTWARSMSF